MNIYTAISGDVDEYTLSKVHITSTSVLSKLTLVLDRSGYLYEYRRVNRFDRYATYFCSTKKDGLALVGCRQHS